MKNIEASICENSPPCAASIFICWLMSRSSSPAVPLLIIDSMTSSVSFCNDEPRSKRQAIHSDSASRPTTVVSCGSVSTGCSGNTGCVTSLPGCHWPKYFSMMPTTWSGSKSPAMQMATLLGTYHLRKYSLILVIDGFFKCSCVPMVVCMP